jgi:hypothetical protein
MISITVDVDGYWLEAAGQALHTRTTAETVNEALRACGMRIKAAELMAALDSVELDCTGSLRAWRYGGGRDLSRIEEDAKAGNGE